MWNTNIHPLTIPLLLIPLHTTHANPTTTCSSPPSPSPTPPLTPGTLQPYPNQPLPTQIFLPSPSASQTSESPTGLRPILIHLHGAPPGGRFDTPPAPTSTSLDALLANDPSFSSSLPLIVLFPCSTCHPDGSPLVNLTGPPPISGPVGWTPETFSKIDAILHSVLSHHRGDPRRVSLTGVSYGTRGLWDYASSHPGKFAALLPLCSPVGPTIPSVSALCCDYTPEDERCHDCPAIWAFHGANDVRADVRGTDAYIQALRNRSGREVRYTRYEEAPPKTGVWRGHHVGDLAYWEEGVWDWIAVQEGGGVGSGDGGDGGYVRGFDGGVERLVVGGGGGGGEVVVVKVDLPGCVECLGLDGFWGFVGGHYPPGRVWRLDCGRDPDVALCYKGGVGGKPQPRFEAWVGDGNGDGGGGWRSYKGIQDLENLSEWIMEMLGGGVGRVGEEEGIGRLDSGGDGMVSDDGEVETEVVVVAGEGVQQGRM